ncbi:MAG: CehA/McbA family metallohydrolase [Phycisphaerales bacterium]|nr:MAG: CehA/McbA family metallohydrolase [Phycisphaerales bacterium]
MTYARNTIAAMALISCLSTGANAADAKTGILELTISDTATGLEIPARVRIRDRFGKDHVPPGSAPVPIANDRWFACSGRVRMEIPAGPASVRVERGTEYRPLIQNIDIEPSKTVGCEVKIERWIDMSERGYASGENHLHVPADELSAMLAAEDLDFGTSLSWWNGPKMEISGERGCIYGLKHGNRAISCSVCDAEVEHSWGAVYLIGLRAPIRIASDGRRSNLPFVRIAHDQKALVCYQAGWSREVLTDALLGYVDVVNVCNNNFHRHKYQPRRRYSNLLNVQGFPEYPNTPQGMLEMNWRTYYRLLNCGLRLAAGAGSATGAKTTPVGYNRAYVRAGANPTLSEFLEAWRRGRNFVTNGPMLFLRTGKNQRPGDTIALPSKGGAVSFEATAMSEQPLRSLEIVANGRVVREADIADKQYGAKVTASLVVDEGTWVAARCTEEDQLLSDEQLGRYSKGGSLPEEPCRLRFAHTSPVYVTVGGKGPFVPSSVKQAQAMLEAFELFARKTASAEYLDELLEALPKEIKSARD